MDVSEIAAWLADYDSKHPQIYLEAEIPRYRGGSGSYPWDFRTDDGNWYVVKHQRNWQDESARQATPGYPLKILLTELICGRLAQLFTPPVSPPVAIVNIPEALAAQCISPPNNQPIAHGPSFGSRLEDNVADGKSGAPLHLISPEQSARLTVFHTWLRGEDLAALVSPDGSRSFSIDHGFFLTGAQWNYATLQESGPEEPRMLLSDWRTSRFTNVNIFRAALDELEAWPEDLIVQQFAGIPVEWGASYEFTARLVGYVLARRKTVESSVMRCGKGVA